MTERKIWQDNKVSLERYCCCFKNEHKLQQIKTLYIYGWHFEIICVLKNLAKGAPNLISGGRGARMALVSSKFMFQIFD